MNATLTLNPAAPEINRSEVAADGKNLDFALNVVEAMQEAGLTAVPLKPSALMLAAGARAGGVSVETVWKIYQAMLREGR